jgi:hypothetical protein
MAVIIVPNLQQKRNSNYRIKALYFLQCFQNFALHCSINILSRHKALLSANALCVGLLSTLRKNSHNKDKSFYTLICLITYDFWPFLENALKI